MLIAAAIVPGPPGFVTELMGSAAHELDDLRRAADSAVSRTLSDLVAESVDSSSLSSASAQLVVVGPGEPAEFNAAGSVAFGSFGHDIAIPALVQGELTDPRLPTPLMVARYLASRDVGTHPEHADLWASARWITTSGAAATVLGEHLRDVDTRVALILVADGALCHGPKAPRAEDSRAQAYDDGVCAALASGKPDRLAELDAEVGQELGASGPQVWPVLSTAAGSDGVGEVLWRGEPYGVGWAVATWRPSAAFAGP